MPCSRRIAIPSKGADRTALFHVAADWRRALLSLVSELLCNLPLAFPSFGTRFPLFHSEIFVARFIATGYSRFLWCPLCIKAKWRELKVDEHGTRPGGGIRKGLIRKSESAQGTLVHCRRVFRSATLFRARTDRCRTPFRAVLSCDSRGGGNRSTCSGPLASGGLRGPKLAFERWPDRRSADTWRSKRKSVKGHSAIHVQSLPSNRAGLIGNKE